MQNFTKEQFEEGEILAFNKPYGWTSFQVVAKVRWLLKKKFGIKKIKVGHAGTLDPLATGVLLVCTGKATKKIERLQLGRKEYIATLKLGATTPSFDKETEEDAQYPVNHIDKTNVEQVLKLFQGEIEQVPPLFSAVKVNGKRAYKFARQGEDIELKAKKIVIDEIELLFWGRETRDEGRETITQLKIRVVCSKGTYIRALARDIGEALHSGAYLTDLCRTRVGDYKINETITIEEIENYEVK